MPQRVSPIRKPSTNFKPSKEKLENSMRYWEQFYRVRLKPDSKRLLLKDATKAIQNRKQISAFCHGALIALMRNSSNLADSEPLQFRNKLAHSSDDGDSTLHAHAEHVLLSEMTRGAVEAARRTTLELYGPK